MENNTNLNWANGTIPPSNLMRGKWQSYRPVKPDSYYASLMSDLDKIDNVSELDEEQVLRIKEKFKEVENSLKEKIKPKTITISGPTHNKIKEHCTITMENIGDWSEKTLLSATKNLSNERILLDALKTYKEKVLRGPNNIEGFMGKDKLVNRINMDIEYYTYQTGLYFQLEKCAPSPYIVDIIKNIPNNVVACMPVDDNDIFYEKKSDPKITDPYYNYNYNNPDYFSDAIINHMNNNNLGIAISVTGRNGENGQGKYMDDVTKAFKDSLRQTPINVITPEKLVIDADDIETSTQNWDGYEKEMSNTTRELLIKHEEKVLREEFEKHIADEKEKRFQSLFINKK